MPAKKYDKGSLIGPLQLEIIERLSGNKAHIICPNCGNKEWYPRISDVVQGKSTNCGCKNKQRIIEQNKNNFKDISNQHFGYLIALKPTQERQNTYVVWDCLCTLCNHHHFANIHDLIKGHVKSCGCWKGSKGEELIKEWLDSHHIKYESQKTFPNCKNPLSGYSLRYDFYIPSKNLVLEYNGIQHYQIVKYFGGEQHYKETLQRDIIKKGYCEKNNIQLEIIRYDEDLVLRLEEIFE